MEKRKFTPAGTKIVPTYEMEIKNGKKRLVKTGTTNIFEKIQQYKEECDINTIIKRCMMGDTSVLNRGHAKYGDFTNQPKNINEYYMMNQKAEKAFYELPVELRKEFDHSYEKYLDEMQNGTAQKKIDKHFNIKEEKQEIVQQATTAAQAIQQVEQIKQPKVENGVIQGQQTINTTQTTGVIYE